MADMAAVARAAPLEGTMRLRIADRLEEVRRLNDSLARFLWDRQVAPDRLHDVQLVMEELVTNVLRHGGSADGRRRIVVEAEVADPHVRLTVEDNGRPFDPTAIPLSSLPAALEERRPGGLGLRIVRRLVTDLYYERLPDGNRVEALILLVSAPRISD